MKNITFEKSACEDFVEWANINKKIYKRIISLIMDILRQPFSGIGKPETLKHELKGYWSRRINDEHRPVYKVDQESITIVSCRYHYE